MKAVLDVNRGFAEEEWLLLRTAAQRLRFLLDFGHATGLRASV